MSETEHKDFTRKLAFHTAPTLLGIKCASLISLSIEEFDINSHAEYFNKRVASKGLKSRMLCSCKSRALILVYSEELLKKRLSERGSQEILKRFGYDTECKENALNNCLERLSQRMMAGGAFPHEIGVFLGYPLEDVRGFIENHGEHFKLCGAWKVYGSVETAKRTFANYDRCRNFLCNKLSEGADIYQALKIS